jgi:hypothetical protein
VLTLAVSSLFIVKFTEQKGRATNFLKPGSKRKRTKSELEEVKEEEKFLKENKQEFLKAVKKLKNDSQAYEEEKQIMRRDQNVLDNLLDHGIIDANGNILG